MAVGCSFGYTNASSVEVKAFHDTASETDETNDDSFEIDAASATGVNDMANFVVTDELGSFTVGTLASIAREVRNATAPKWLTVIGHVGA